MIVQLFIIFFGLPSVGIILDAFPSAVIAFALNLGAYNAEVFRSAIQAVPAGQTEAAYMIGLTKDTSLASSITVVDYLPLHSRLQQGPMSPLHYTVKRL